MGDQPKCADCKWCRNLYVPHLPSLEDIPKDAYVCFVNLEPGGDMAMFMRDNKGCCELYEECRNG